jgi:hypothetical protein
MHVAGEKREALKAFVFSVLRAHVFISKPRKLPFKIAGATQVRTGPLINELIILSVKECIKCPNLPV